MQSTVPGGEDPALTRIVENPARMREFFQQHLRSIEGRSLDVRECKVTNMRRRDGSRGTVQYDVRLADPSNGHTWDQIVTGVLYGEGRTRRVWEHLRHADAAHAATADRPALRPYAFVPELDMLVQVFPHDHRLPALAILLNGAPPDVATPILEDFGREDWQLRHWNTEVVQYRADMRATVRLSVGAAAASSGPEVVRTFYAKIFRDADASRRSFALQQHLYEQVNSSEVNLAVAKPLVHVDRLRTVVTEAVAGTSLAKIIRRGDVVIPAVRAAARVVSEFHHLDVSAPPRPVTEEISRLRQAQESLRETWPEMAGEVSDLVDTIIAGLDDCPSMLIHGDLKPEHILVDGDRVALLDFDLIADADPVIDVAHLVAFLSRPRERSQGRRNRREPGVGTAAQVFVDEYFRHVPASWRGRVPIYHAMTSIHKATGLSRRRGADQRRLVESILREGQALLAGTDNEIAPTFKRRMTRSVPR